MSEVVERTQNYYDSADADEFYFRIWGGEDIHIGLYNEGEKDIFAASRRTVERMANYVADRITSETKVLDLGAGYGGSARYLAKRFGCHVTALNLSLKQNERDRQMNQEQGLADKIDVVDGNFEDLPYEDNSFDVIWSQDSFLHSGERRKVFAEMDRVLKPGGDIIFTDPMQKHGVDREQLRPVLDRIQLETMGSIEDYRQYAREFGWEELAVERMTGQLVNHYSNVHDHLESREKDLEGVVSQEYIDNMKRGLNHWVNAGKKELLAWGILHFRKPA